MSTEVIVTIDQLVVEVATQDGANLQDVIQQIIQDGLGVTDGVKVSQALASSDGASEVGGDPPRRRLNYVEYVGDQ